MLLIRSPAASRSEPPLLTQTCRNGYVVTRVPCSQGQSTRHPVWIDMTDSSTHERVGSPNIVPHPGLVCGLHSSPDCWSFTSVFPALIFFGRIFQLWPRLFSTCPVREPAPLHYFGSKVWTLSTWGSSTSSYCGHSLDQMNQICELHRGSYLDTWSAWVCSIINSTLGAFRIKLHGAVEEQPGGQVQAHCVSHHQERQKAKRCSVSEPPSQVI